jgi:hypothetical protein
MERAVAAGLAAALAFAMGCGSGDTSQGSADDGGGTDATSTDGTFSSDAAAADSTLGADGPGSPDTSSPDGGANDGPLGPGNPPFGASSKGSGGTAPVNGTTVQAAGGVTYYLIVPSSYASGTATPLLVVYSGTEGGATMTQNLLNLGQQAGIANFICAVLDGVTYYGNGAAGASALDDVRAKYDVDNDRTYLLGESAGTTAALMLGFHLRESYFAAYWANDVNASDGPAQNAAQLGFAPWGQAGPGGDLTDATSIVSAMQAAGYRLPNPAPYNGPGSTTHGDLTQFIAAVSFYAGKTRK